MLDCPNSLDNQNVLGSISLDICDQLFLNKLADKLCKELLEL